MLLAAAVLGRRLWVTREDDRARRLALASVGMLATVALWAPLAALFSVGDLPAQLWMAPLDRLLLTVALVVVSWALCGSPSSPLWKAALATGLAVSVVAYAGWAPVWAREARLTASAGDMVGAARAWDAARIVLACAATAVLIRRGRAPTEPAVLMLAFLALGGLLDVVAPGNTGFPAWSRLAALAGGVALATVAATDTALAGRQREGFQGRLSGLMPQRGRLRKVRQPAAASNRPAGPSSTHCDPARDSAADLALRTTADSLSARPVFVALLTPEGDVEVRGLASQASRPVDLGVFRLDGQPTIQAALARGRVQVPSSHLATDLDRLFGKVSSVPVGPALVEPIATDRPYGVIVAGRRRGAWEDHHVRELADIASRAAQELESIDARQRAAGEAARALGAIDVQGAAITRITCSVERLDRRVGALEARVAGLVADSQDVTEGATPYDTLEGDAEADGLGPATTAAVAAAGSGMGPTIGSELLPAVADALQAPISSILGYSDLMNRSDGLAPDHMGRFLKRIDANLARMQVMLGNLAAICEIDGPEAPAPQTVDLAPVVRDAVARARPPLDENARTIEVSVADDLPLAVAEPRAMVRIVDNLLVNAVMRSPQGADVRVAVRLAASDGGSPFVLLSFADRGRGSRGVPGTVYEVDEADASPVAMRLVRLLTARQGGRAWAESVSGGETFHVRVPAAAAADGAAPEPAPGPRRGRR